MDSTHITYSLSLDAPTLVVAMIMCQSVLALGMIFSSSRIRRFPPPAWAFTAFLQILGWSLLLFSPYLSQHIALPVSMWALSLSFSLIYLSLCQFLDQKITRWLVWFPCLFASGQLIFWSHSPELQAILSPLILGLQLLLCSVPVLRYQGQNVSTGSIRLMLFGLFSAAAGIFVRVVQAMITQESILVPYASFMLNAPLLLAHLASLLTINLSWLMFMQDRVKAKQRKLASEDSLTGLFNRYHLFQVGPQKLAKARQTGLFLTLLLIDLDHFKRINDTWGHNMGDLVLKKFANAVRDSIRPSDLATRYGGEEFCILLEAGPEAAKTIARRLKERLARQTDLPEGLTIRFSGGIAYTNGDDTLEQLISCADQAMYLAKNTGRNQVFLATDACKNANASCNTPMSDCTGLPKLA